jgi:hypothetical protein
VTALVWLLEAVLLGCLLVYRWTDLRSLEPAWAAWLLIFGAGAASGIGVTSCLFFICGVLLESPLAALVLELAAVAWLAYEAFRRRVLVTQTSSGTQPPVALPWIAGALLLALGIATAAMAIAWDLNPHGNWDAWAIWNLRAKFLASPGGLAERAWSPVLAATSHPGYPLLVSAFVGRCGAFSHSSSQAVPLATSYVFFIAMIALAAGGLTILRGPTLGLLAALVLAATPSLLHEVPAQYADVPLACYFAGALVFALLDRPMLAGVFAGFAAWTKDEGLLLLIVVLAAVAVFRRRAILPAIAGALPVAALVAFFKLLLAGGGAPQLSTNPAAAGHQLIDVARVGTVAAAFVREFVAMGAGWYHPILPFVILAFILGFDRQRDTAFCGVIATALLLCFFGVYMVTANDLTWILQTSLNRIMLQVWPALLLAGFLSLRAPEAAAIVIRTPQPKVGRKARV